VRAGGGRALDRVGGGRNSAEARTLGPLAVRVSLRFRLVSHGDVKARVLTGPLACALPASAHYNRGSEQGRGGKTPLQAGWLLSPTLLQSPAAAASPGTAAAAAASRNAGGCCVEGKGSGYAFLPHLQPELAPVRVCLGDAGG